MIRAIVTAVLSALVMGLIGPLLPGAEPAPAPHEYRIGQGIR